MFNKFGSLVQMDNQNTTEQIANVLKIYTSWKAAQPLHPEEHNIIEQKLNPKFKPQKRKGLPLSLNLTKRKELHMIEFKSKELIPEDYWEREQSPKTLKGEENLNLFRRKNSGTIAISRYKSVQNVSNERQSHQKIFKIKLKRGNSSNNLNEKDGFCQQESPMSSRRIFRAKEQFPRNTPDKTSSPTLKTLNWKDFCLSSKRQYTHFLRAMTKSDFHILSRHCKIDMSHLIFKIKKEEQMRKVRAIQCWQHFNYNEIHE